jgi:putative ABC transport system ATP-binding protein
MVTHDQPLATRCASRLIEVADGRVVRESSLERTP